MVAPQGKRKLEQFLIVLMDEQGGVGLSPRMILLVEDARTQWAELDRRIAAFDAEFVRWAKENEDARRLTTIPGVGAIIASALVAASVMRKASAAAAISPPGSVWFRGSSPPAASRSCWGSASAATDICARQLIHGARAALPYVAERDTPLGRWAKALMARAHRNVAVVAFANKLARIAWAVLRRGEPFAATGIPAAG